MQGRSESKLHAACEPCRASVQSPWQLSYARAKGILLRNGWSAGGYTRSREYAVAERGSAVISRDKLQAGSCYFLVTYQDCNAGVPVVETLRFQSEVSENDPRAPLFLFERVGEAGQRQCRLSEDLLTRIFEFDALVSEFAARAGERRAGTPYEPRYCDD